MKITIEKTPRETDEQYTACSDKLCSFLVSAYRWQSCVSEDFGKTMVFHLRELNDKP